MGVIHADKHPIRRDSSGSLLIFVRRHEWLTIPPLLSKRLGGNYAAGLNLSGKAWLVSCCNWTPLPFGWLLISQQLFADNANCIQASTSTVASLPGAGD